MPRNGVPAPSPITRACFESSLLGQHIDLSAPNLRVRAATPSVHRSAGAGKAAHTMVRMLPSLALFQTPAHCEKFFIPDIPACPVRPKSGHSPNARVYEFTP